MWETRVRMPGAWIKGKRVHSVPRQQPTQRKQDHGMLDALTTVFAGHPLPIAWGPEMFHFIQIFTVPRCSLPLLQLSRDKRGDRVHQSS
jgi:hypothetical protein